MFSTLGVVQLGQTYLSYLSFANTSALIFEKMWTSDPQFFVGFRGGCRQEVRVSKSPGDFEDEDVDKMPRSTAVGLDMLKDLRQVFWNLNNAITFNYCNWMQLVQLSMIP